MIFIFNLWDWDDEPRKKYSKRERELVWKDQGKRCMYCGIRGEVEYFDMDHKNPHSKGGSNSLSNIHMLCSPCNKRKSKMTDSEFRKKFKLGPSRGAKPPKKVIKQEVFKEIAKKASAKRRKKKREEDDWFW